MKVETEEITILHFNDVYHISDADQVARFASVLADPRYVTGDTSVPEHQLRIFSGDVFSPSLEASVLRGEHMPALLNSLNLDVACYGNHDFDFGDARLIHLSERTNFPWTLTNAIRKPRVGGRHQFLAGAHEYIIREIAGHRIGFFGLAGTEIAGHRIGFFGLAGTDWPSNCQHLPSCDILDPAVVAKETARQLRRQEKCDLVIALTHMRLAEDIGVSRATISGDCGVDLLLGGHDHDVLQRLPGDDDIDPDHLQQGVPHGDAAVTDFEGDVRIVKSGTDWRGLSIVRLKVARQNNGTSSILDVKLKQISDLRKMPGYSRIPPCPKALSIISDIHAKIENMVQRPLLMTEAPLEGRSQVVRRQESNLGNMLADAVREFYGTDIGFVNSGAIRCDRIIPAHLDKPLSIRDVIDISPFDNAFVVKRVSGRVLARAFENSVSDAHMDGRFLQVSGMKLTADWSCREGSRVMSMTFLPRGGRAPEAIAAERLYTVAMVDFIASGFDGYSCFRDAETLVEKEGAMTDTNLLLQVFGAAPAQEAGVGVVDSNTEGIARAKGAIIRGSHVVNGLPVIGPKLEGRIQFVNKSNL
ncbi:Trifunctional nucleotide phosphoesterase protein [Escovopsis weberi]|uniref:Trifunctional nucleotide phosphoesterase protein n=1 Tax=Escovopsis weberi TaxID=150374 RepID=A0A0M9VSL0_ESCWE|nr:Trifunctional nucleotide phosphoesterase protein [Escovopsis weberi]